MAGAVIYLSSRAQRRSCWCCAVSWPAAAGPAERGDVLQAGRDLEGGALATDLLGLRVWALWYLNERGDSVTQAVEIGMPLLAYCERVRGEWHLDTLTTREILAQAYQSAGRVGEARLQESWAPGPMRQSPFGVVITWLGKGLDGGMLGLVAYRGPWNRLRR
jgi:hypothetical protein